MTSVNSWEHHLQPPKSRSSDSQSDGAPQPDDLRSFAYDELRRLAAAVRRGDPFTTVTTTSLVHEAWIKLASSKPAGVASQLHLKHIVVRAMRQVLVDSARRRRSIKRSGITVPLDEAGGLPIAAEEHVLAIDGALERLAVLNPRQASLVEARFFGGLEVEEAARLLGVSEATAARDWRLARAWLKTELKDSA